MYVDKNSVIINNVNMGQYLLQADFEYNKLWRKRQPEGVLHGSQSRDFTGNFC